MNSVLTILVLFGSGLLGITHYILEKYKEEKKKFHRLSFKRFLDDEWTTIAIRVCFILACLIGRQYVTEVYNAGSWLFFAFYMFGLMSDTVIQRVKNAFVK